MFNSLGLNKIGENFNNERYHVKCKEIDKLIKATDNKKGILVYIR